VPNAAPYTSWLRVYEPLEAFPEPERFFWQSYVADPARPSTAELVRREQQESLVRAVLTPPHPTPAKESQDAFVLVEGGTPYVCPRHVRLRSWEALAELRTGLPDVLIQAFFPGDVLERSESAHTQWRRRNPDLRPRIEEATWYVPLRWFVAFSATERQLTYGTEDAERSLTYRTPMVEARRRIARALRTLRRTLDEGPVIDGVEDLGRWLEGFHPRSWVELDYGGVVHLMDDQALGEDCSAEDVAAAIAALEAGDGDAAGEAYERLLLRWRDVQACEHAS
jgi:hypothetical protein